MTYMNMHGTAASCKPGRIWLSSLRNNLACICIQLIHPATHNVVGRNTHCQHSIRDEPCLLCTDKASCANGMSYTQMPLAR